MVLLVLVLVVVVVVVVVVGVVLVLVVVVVVVLLVALVCCGDGGDCVGDGVDSRGATCLRRGEDIDSSRPPLASRLWLVALTRPLNEGFSV